MNPNLFVGAVTRALAASAFLMLAMPGNAHADPTCRTDPDMWCPIIGSAGHAECNNERLKPLCEAPPKFLKSARSIVGTLVEGRGSDMLIITIRRADGKKVRAWCHEVCDEWSELSVDGNEEHVKKAYLGKRVRATLRTERNNGRLPGADEADEFLFVKKITFVQ